MVQPVSVFKLEWDNHITATSSVHIEIYRLQTVTWSPSLMLSYPSFLDTCEMGQTKVDVLVFEVKEIMERHVPGIPRVGQQLGQESNLHLPRPSILTSLLGTAVIFTGPVQEYTWMPTYSCLTL